MKIKEKVLLQESLVDDGNVVSVGGVEFADQLDIFDGQSGVDVWLTGSHLQEGESVVHSLAPSVFGFLGQFIAHLLFQNLVPDPQSLLRINNGKQWPLDNIAVSTPIGQTLTKDSENKEIPMWLSDETYVVLAIDGNVVDVPLGVKALKQLGENSGVVQVINDFIGGQDDVGLGQLDEVSIVGQISQSDSSQFRQQFLSFGVNSEVPVNRIHGQ